MVGPGLTVGGWFAGATISNVVAKVRSIVEDNHGLRAEAGDMLDSVEYELLRIKILVETTERRPISTEHLNSWLKKLKDAVFEAEDLLDDFEIKRIQATINKGKVSSIVFFGLKYLRTLVLSDADLQRLKAVLTNLNKITSEVGNFRDLLNNCTEDSCQKKFQLKKDEEERKKKKKLLKRPVVVGRDEEKKQLLNKIFPRDGSQSDTGFSLISIVGDAGVGKTTLAQEIYNDPNVKEAFVLRGWVFASRNCTLRGLREDITDSFATEQQEENLQERSLISVIKDKKFFLVLDDVHDNQYDTWCRLRPTLEAGANGSVVLLTCQREEAIINRFGETIHTTELRSLPLSDMRIIFEDHAFGEKSETSLESIGKQVLENLESIGKQVLEKLHGLPLLAEVIGRLLREKLDMGHWQKISTSDWWSFSEDNDDSISVPSVAIMSEHLCHCLTKCLYYCSIFPSGYLFEKNMLVHMWIASFNQNHDRIGMGKMEEEWFDQLLSRSLFQSTVWKNRYIIPDMIRKPLGIILETQMGQKECHAATESGEPTWLQEYRHLAINYSDFNVHPILTEGNKLRTILFFDGHNTIKPDEAFAKILSHPSGLRVLDFSYTKAKMKKAPDFINKFTYLRFLDLSFTQITEFPDSLCKLSLLQVLGLRGCQFKELPRGITELMKLQFLYAEAHTVSLIYKIGKLTNLQGLEEFPVGRMEGHKITELKDLNQISGQLCIGNLEEVASTDIVGDAKLSCKRHLKKLVLKWGMAAGTPKTASHGCMRTLEGLKPNSNLDKLKIQCYMGIAFPAWMADTGYFNKLRRIHLIECKQLLALPPLGQIPSLEKLILQGLSEIEIIGDELYGNSHKVFPSLKELMFLDMQKWKKWLGRETRPLIPKLKKVIIDGCPNLSEAPLHSFSETLLELVLSNCDLVLAGGRCLQGLGKLKRLKISKNPGSITLPCSSLTSLVVLNVSNDEKELDFGGQKKLLTNLKTVVIGGRLQVFADEAKPVYEDTSSSEMKATGTFAEIDADEALHLKCNGVQVS